MGYCCQQPKFGEETQRGQQDIAMSHFRMYADMIQDGNHIKVWAPHPKA
jgi:hypothetical protein